MIVDTVGLRKGRPLGKKLIAQAWLRSVLWVRGPVLLSGRPDSIIRSLPVDYSVFEHQISWS